MYDETYWTAIKDGEDDRSEAERREELLFADLPVEKDDRRKRRRRVVRRGLLLLIALALLATKLGYGVEVIGMIGTLLLILVPAALAFYVGAVVISMLLYLIRAD